MTHSDAINISVEQLLELRHLPTPVKGRTPDSNSIWLGSFSSKKRGQGSDYDDVRLYSRGDDIRHIDWRASARMTDLHTRLYRDQKEHRITVLCDLRAGMYTGSTTLRAYNAIMLAARMLWQVCRQNSRATLVIIGFSGIDILEPGSSYSTAIRGCSALEKYHQHALQLLRNQNHRTSGTAHNKTVAAQQQDVLSSDPSLKSRYQQLDTTHWHMGPTLERVVRHLDEKGLSTSSMLWLTALDNTGNHFYESLGLMANRNSTVVIYIDEALLQDAVQTGDYHYQYYADTNPMNIPQKRSIRITRKNKAALKLLLEQARQQRIANFDKLMIPFLSNAHGDNAVIAALRREAFIP